MNRYLKISTIGQGAFGTVYKVKCRVSGSEFALKCMNSTDVDDSTVRELSCLTALRGHPHVIEMLDCFLCDRNVAVLMPYVPYTLSQAIHSGYFATVMPTSFLAHFSLQLAAALSHMHGLNIVHRDLTPSNVLLTKDLNVKVADFGVSRLASLFMSLPVVTVPYRAPELFAAQGDIGTYNCAIDMWSLGVIIADAVEGCVVFRQRTFRGQTFTTEKIITAALQTGKIKRSRASRVLIDAHTVMPNVMSNDSVKRIVLKLLALRPGSRIMARELLSDKQWTGVRHMSPEDVALVKRQMAQHASVFEKDSDNQ